MISKTFYSRGDVGPSCRGPWLQWVLFILLGFLLGSVLLNCATRSDATRSEKNETTEADPNVQDEVYYLDSASFDNKLYKMLADAPPSATVKFNQTITLNEIPERIDKWLYRVEENGGVVQMEMEPAFSSRGIVTELFSLVVGLYTVIREKALYDPVKHYNATVFYLPDSGEITRVVFFHK